MMWIQRAYDAFQHRSSRRSTAVVVSETETLEVRVLLAAASIELTPNEQLLLDLRSVMPSQDLELVAAVGGAGGK